MLGREEVFARIVRDLVDEGHPVEVRDLRVGLESVDGREVKRSIPRGEVVGATRIGGHRALVPAALVASADLEGDVLCDLERVLRVEAHRLAVVLVLRVAVAPGRSAPVRRVVAIVAERRADDQFVVERAEPGGVDPLGRELVGVDVVVGVPVAVAAALEVAARERLREADGVVFVDHAVGGRVESVSRAAVEIAVAVGVSRVVLPLVAREVAGKFAVDVGPERGEANEGAVVEVLLHAAAGVVGVKAAVVAVAVGMIPAAVDPVLRSPVLDAAAKRRARADSVPAAAVKLDMAARLVVVRIGDDVDHSGRADVAVKDVLRALEDFDALNCAEADLREVGRVHVGAVEPLAVDDDEEATEAVFAVAAGGELRKRRVVRAEVREVERDALLLEQVCDVSRAARGDFATRDDLDRGGDFVRDLADARGLDNDWRQFGRRSLVCLCGVGAE